MQIHKKLFVHKLEDKQHIIHLRGHSWVHDFAHTL